MLRALSTICAVAGLLLSAALLSEDGPLVLAAFYAGAGGVNAYALLRMWVRPATDVHLHATADGDVRVGDWQEVGDE